MQSGKWFCVGETEIARVMTKLKAFSSLCRRGSDKRPHLPNCRRFDRRDAPSLQVKCNRVVPTKVDILHALKCQYGVCEQSLLAHISVCSRLQYCSHKNAQCISKTGPFHEETLHLRASVYLTSRKESIVKL